MSPRSAMFESASGFVVRHLKKERILALRAQYFSLRKKLYPVMRLAYGTFDVTALREHLEQRLDNQFEILMVHSSVNNMKPTYTDGPLELVRMLISFCGPNRTLAMPAFYFGDSAIGGAYATFKQQPRFDLRRTPSQMGLATELFRRWKGVKQSRHPVYRLSALGPLAEALTRGHESAGTCVGRGTPFDFMANHDTLIIGIGKPFEVLTQVHHAEELMGENFPVPRACGDSLYMTLVDGEQEIPFHLEQSRVLGRLNVWKLRTIMAPERLKQWKFHNVPIFATHASEVSSALITAAKNDLTLYERS
jgi:aminoglycoside 3-N-acetyltransferase